jgi:hypothetical protein
MSHYKIYIFKSLNDHEKDRGIEFCRPFADFTEAIPSFGLHIRSVFTGMELLTNRTVKYGEQKTHPPHEDAPLHSAKCTIRYALSTLWAQYFYRRKRNLNVMERHFLFARGEL